VVTDTSEEKARCLGWKASEEVDKENCIKIIIPLLSMSWDTRVECKKAWQIYINAITCNASAQNKEIIVKWVVKEHIFKIQNVGKHQSSQTAGCCEYCDEHKAK
jgi:hypothetical protein